MLRAENLQKSFGAGEGRRQVLRGLSLAVMEGEIFCVVGRSGCGKSTLLRLLGGFEPPDGGRVLYRGSPLAAPCSAVFLVHQDFNQLFPWKTLEQNLLFALKKARPGLDRARALESARGWIARVGLTGNEKRYPHELSGGMKQRGALARALALGSRVLLLDEPFSSLDALSRRGAQELLRSLCRESNVAAVLVTHDLEEALRLSTRVGVLEGGVIAASYENTGEPALGAALEGRLQAGGAGAPPAGEVAPHG